MLLTLLCVAEIHDLVHNAEQASSIIEHDANQLEFSCATAYEGVVA